MTNRADETEEANWGFERTTHIVVDDNDVEPEERRFLANPGFSE